MNKSTAEFLTNKCIKSLKFYEPKVQVFDTALEMLQYIWPDTYINIIRYYESHMKKSNYVSASNNFTFHKSTYSQPS